jgi:hypothetical protein
MALVTDQFLCLRTQATLDQISDGLYTNLETGIYTNALSDAIDASDNGALSQVTNQTKLAPGDATCTEINATVKIQVPDCGDNACAAIAMDCNISATNPETYVHDQVTYDDSVCHEFSVAAEDFDCSCDDPFRELATKMYNAARKMKKEYNDILAANLVGEVGEDFAGNNTALFPKPLKLLFENANGQIQPQPMGLFSIDQEYDYQAPHRTVNPVIVTSSQKFRAYLYAQGIYAGNDEGADGSRKSMPNVFYDPALLDAVTAAGGPTTAPAISWLPGSLSLLKWYDYGHPEHQVQGTSFFEGMVRQDRMVRTIMDIGTPTMGTPFLVDAQIRYDECVGTHGTVNYKFRKIFGLYCPDQSALCAGTNFNFKLLWDLQCAAFGCSDIEI